MSNHLPIKALINLAEEELEATTKKLGKLQQERDEVELQLNSLVKYRDEYHARFTASAQEGTTAQTLRNFQAFVDTLDSAINQQRALLVTANQRLEAAKPEWQQRKQKLGSYEVLAARGEALNAKHDPRTQHPHPAQHPSQIP